MKNTQKTIYQDTAFLFLSLLLVFVSFFTTSLGTIEISFFALFVALASTVLFSADLLHIAFKNAPFKHLKENTQGIVGVWVVAAATIGMTALAWFVVSYPLFMIIDLLTDTYTYPSQTQGIITLVQTALAWFLGIEVFGVLLWALVSSHRREDQTYPM